MAEKFVNQFMAEKAGMDSVDRSLIHKKVQELSKGSRKQEFEKEMEEKRQHQLNHMLNKINMYEASPDKNVIKQEVKHKIAEVQKYRDLTRIWAHFDFDMFYVACEILDRPDLVEKPCAVGTHDGVLCTANYVARKFGIRSAQPTFLAKSICPYLVLIPPNFEKYRKYSNIFRDILAEFDENYESHGLDEAYVDITDHVQGKTTEQINDFIRNIRNRIFNQTKLTVSCGVGANKMLCKMASEEKKPNDQFILPNDREVIIKFVGSKPIRKIPGIGPVNEYFLKGIGITTGAQLFEKMDHIRVCFTEHTLEGFIFNALGISSNIHELKERKSVGRSDTFKVTDEEKFWLSMLDKLTERVSEDLKELELVAKTVTLSYQTQNFEKRDKSQTLDNYTCEKQDLLDVVVKMLTKEVNYGTRLRLLGVRCTNLLNMEQNKKNTLHAYFSKAMNNITSQSNTTLSTAREESPKHKSERFMKPDCKDLMNHSDSSENRSKSVQRDFECPVCQKTIECRSNYSKFERHINKCLQEPAKSEQIGQIVVEHRRQQDSPDNRKMKKPTSLQRQRPATQQEMSMKSKPSASKSKTSEYPKKPKQTDLSKFLKK